MRKQDELVEFIFSKVSELESNQCGKSSLLHLADMGRESLNTERCTIWLLDEVTGTLYTEIAHGVENIRINKDSGLVGYAVSRGKPVIVNNPKEDKRFNPEVDKKSGFVTKSVLVVPIKDLEGNIIGAFQTLNKLNKDGEVIDFSEEDLELSKLISFLASTGLENAKKKYFAV